MQSFIEYIDYCNTKETEMISQLDEAVHNEMREVFKTADIQDFGRKLSRLGISLQDSEVQPWGPKGFKLSKAKEHKVHIVKVKNTPGYVMLYYVNARSADIIENTTGVKFENAKEVYAQAQKVFTFNTSVDTQVIRRQRWENNFNYFDPLKRNQATRDRRLQELKAKKAKDSYADTVMQELKQYGIGIKGLRVVEGVFYVDEMRVANLSRYITKEIIQVGLQDRPTLKITVNAKPFTGSTDIERLIHELEDALKAAEALDNIDKRKLNQN